MAIYHLRLAPVKKAGTALGRSAHHGAHRLTRGALGKAAYLAAERLADNGGEIIEQPGDDLRFVLRPRGRQRRRGRCGAGSGGSLRGGKR